MEMKLTLPPVIQNPALLSQPTPGALNTGYSTKGSCIIPLSPTPMDSLQQQRLLFIRQFSERLEISKDHQLYEINPQEVVNKLLIENIIENTSSRRNSHRYTADGSDTTSTVSTNQQQQSWTPPNRHMKAFTFTTSTPQQQKMMMNPPPARKSNRSNNSSSAGAAASHNLLKESIMNMNAGHTPRPPGQNVSSSQSKHFFPSNPAPQSVQYDYHKYSNRPLPQPSNDPRQHSPAVISTLQALNPFAKKSNTPRSNQDDEREEERHPNDYEDGDRDHDDTASQISFVREQLLADDNTELRKLPSEFHHYHHHSYHHPVPHHHQPEQHQSEKRQLKRTLSNHQEGSLSPKQRTEDIYLKDNCLPIDDYPADYEELEEYKARNTNNEEEYDSDYWEDERLMLKWEARRMGLIYFGIEELQKHTQQMKLSEEERMKLLMK